MIKACLHDLLLAPPEYLVASGGDARLAVDARTGLNSYGCAMLPSPHTLSFGSSTASTISEAAFRRVRREYDRLHEPDFCLDDAMENIRRELRSLLGIPQGAAEVVFSPSGTDSVLHALFLTRVLNGPATPLDCILAASDETGSGVPLALAGRHFSSLTAEGVAVNKGESVAGLDDGVRLIPVPVSGTARMDVDVFEAVSSAVHQGRRVLLQVMDGAKCGGRYPSTDCLQRILSRYGEAVTVVVDACQMRLSLPRLRRYLAAGYMVLASGSKFFSGPPFSGVLLVPSASATRLASNRHIPAGLPDYTSRVFWPRAWGSLRDVLPDRQNIGPYLRWTAALDEMARYFAVPQQFRRRALAEFSGLAMELIGRRSPDLVPLAGDVSLLENWEDDSEMGVQTIFPFAPRRNGRWLSHDDTIRIYQALNRNFMDQIKSSLSPEERSLAGTSCHLGQPVRVTMEDGHTTGALRLSAGAPTVCRQWSQCRQTSRGDAERRLRRDLEMTLDKVLLVLGHLPALG